MRINHDGKGKINGMFDKYRRSSMFYEATRTEIEPLISGGGVEGSPNGHHYH